MADSWGSIPLKIFIDSSTGAFPLPTYPTYGSTRHVPNSTIDITQYTGTGPGQVTYSLHLQRTDYDALVAAYRAIPRAADTLTVGEVLGEWYVDKIGEAEVIFDGSVFCSVTFREES